MDVGVEEVSSNKEHEEYFDAHISERFISTRA